MISLAAVDRFVVIFIYLALTQVLSPILIGSYHREVPDDATGVQYMWIVTYVCAGGLLLARQTWTAKTLTLKPSIWLFVAICALTYVWSIDPGVTIRRWISLAGTAMIGFYFGLRLTFREQFLLTFRICSLLTVLSVAAALAGLDIARFRNWEGGDIWQGVFDHKNKLGLVSSLTAACILLQAWHTKRVSLGNWLLLPITGLALVKSQSATPLGATIAGMGVVVLTSPRVRNRLTPQAVMAMGTVVVVFVLTILGIVVEKVLSAMGKSTDLSGRTHIWEAAAMLISWRPLGGYGWGDVTFTVPQFSRFFYQAHDTPAHAHNGFLNTALQAGIPATLLTLGITVRAFNQSIRLASAGISPWAIFFIPYSFVYNCFEIALFAQQRLVWVLFLAVLCRMQLMEDGTDW